MCGFDALTYAACRNPAKDDCASIRTTNATAAIDAMRTAACLAPLMNPPYFLGGVDGAGLANFAASIVVFARTCVSSKLSRPSSHVIVNLYGIFTPATSR